MLKKTVIGAAAAGTIVWIAYMIYAAMVSDETRIRWLLEGMAEDFNAGDAAALCSGLAEDFREEESGTDRRLMAMVLLGLFRDARRPDGSFPFRVELPEIPGPDATIEVDEPGEGEPTASLRLKARFFILPAAGGEAAAPQPLGAAEFEARLIVEGGDWKILSARREIIEGRMPF